MASLRVDDDLGARLGVARFKVYSLTRVLLWYLNELSRARCLVQRVHLLLLGNLAGHIDLKSFEDLRLDNRGLENRSALLL